jgi:hypothetical protein
MDRDWSNQKKVEFVMDFSNKTDWAGRPKNVKLPTPSNPGLGAGRTKPFTAQKEDMFSIPVIFLGKSKK